MSQESNPPQTALIAQSDAKVMEFVPFGATDKIKLSVEIIKNLVAVKTKSGKTCGNQDAIKFMMMCQARRLNPFEGDAFLIGYDGREGPQFSLITAHQAFLKRAEVNPEYDGMKSGIIIKRDGEIKDVEGDFYLEGDELLGGWATVFFKNRKQSMHKRIRLKRFQKAWGIWQEDPAGMICKCAEADALRSSFPTMLGGLYLREELVASEPTKFAVPVFKEKEAKPTPGALLGPSTIPESPATPEPEPEFPPATPPPGVPVPQEAPRETEPENPIKRLRALCREAKIKESKVIEFLQDVGSVGNEVGTFEEVALNAGETIKMLVSQWDDISTRIKNTKPTQ